MSSLRILLCGDVLGRLNQLFKRFATVNKSAGPFDALFCVGQFFPDSEENLNELLNYTGGKSVIPIPTYFIGDYGAGASRILITASKNPLNDGFKTDGLKICNNLFWLKGSGNFLLHGLHIAYLSGRHFSYGQPNGAYGEDDVDALRALAEEPELIDLFLTNEWPSGILNLCDPSNVPIEASKPSGFDPVLSELAAKLKPRYHIAGTKDIYYAREPYSNEEALHITRFLGLASVGNKGKQKFIHAISPTPASTMSDAEIRTKPSNTTSLPYEVAEKKARFNDTKQSGNSTPDSQYWRYDTSRKRQKTERGVSERLCFNFTSTGSCSRGDGCNFRHDPDAQEQYSRGWCFDFINRGKCERENCNFKHALEDDDKKGSRSGYPKDGRSNTGRNCWFCLSSPNVESHLILSIGDSYYCALAKGPLVQEHILIIPVEHCPGTLSIAQEMDAELKNYKISLRNYFKQKGEDIVFYEFKNSKIGHANLQAVPVPFSKAGHIQESFVASAKKLGFGFSITIQGNQYSDTRQILNKQFDPDMDYFFVELTDGTILSHSEKDMTKFPVQFGREVLARLLGLQERADWRKCKLSKEDEVHMVASFKKRFKQFDPTT